MIQTNKLKILVTGADGMLGSNLVRELLNDQYEVSVFVLPGTKAKTLAGLDLQFYHGDITDAESLNSAVTGKDVVVHAAASTSVWPTKSEAVRRVNINGTRNIIEKVLEHRIGKLIFVGSASSVNGQAVKPVNNTGNERVHVLDYIDSKHKAFQLVTEAIRQKNLPASIVLPTFMIGPYDSKPGSGKIILSQAQGKIKFFTGGGKNFVHVKDVTRVIGSLILDENSSGKTVVAGNRNLTYREFFKLTSIITGKPAPKFKIPDWEAKMFGRVSEAIARLSGKPPLISYQMAKISCEKQFVENTIGDLNLEPLPLENAILECYEWFIKNKYL